MAGWEVIETIPITLHRTNRLADMYVLSPFVWREGDRFRVLVRAVPRRDDEPRLKMSEVWHGVSDDGVDFDMDIAPAIFPGPDLADLDGCEDPTVRVDGDQVRVWYTGFNSHQQTGRLMLARGPDVARLAKAGVALDSASGFRNPKEASVARIGAQAWRMLFEYAAEGASRIGQAQAVDLDGPWTDVAETALRAREGRWDDWHLSPGPVLAEGGEAPVMFYNGATQEGRWRIGWAVFDRAMARVVDRCDGPLITPDAHLEGVARDIAFAASVVRQGAEVRLYYSCSDQDLRCARLRAR